MTSPSAPLGMWLALLATCASAGAEILILQDIDSGTTSPQGHYRWMDVADQLYAVSYRETYDYTQATVVIEYANGHAALHGTRMASNLKPSFAYQLKLVGKPDVDPNANERIGLTGRWWQEEWDGTHWANGQNLNNKGDGASPNPNDEVYFARRDIPDANSPTGLHYHYTGYLVLDYFMTDPNGDTTLVFRADSSYHVLWKTSQRSPSPEFDGPVKAVTFDPDPNHAAYDVDYGESTEEIFGEWERLPTGGVFLPPGGVFLPPGGYTADFVLTEESFHGGGLAGGWAAAMGGQASFDVVAPMLTLTIVNDLWGAVTVDPNLPTYPPDAVVTLTAYPVEGRTFRHWEIYDPNYPGDANCAVLDSNLSTTILMDSHREVTAVFKCSNGMDELLPLLAVGMMICVLTSRRIRHGRQLANPT